jgi:WXG100 family type VII secretion target
MTASAGDGYIHVNYGQVNDVYDALESADKAIQMVLSELESTASRLSQSWIGSSQQEYTMVQTRWNNDMNDMSTTLANARATLSEMSINYGNTDNNLAMQWSEIL